MKHTIHAPSTRSLIKMLNAVGLVGHVPLRESITLYISPTVNFADNFSPLSCPSKCECIFKEDQHRQTYSKI